MRPLVLICNDAYHASLRPLRLSGLAETIHVGKPPLDAVVARLKAVFEREGIACEKEAARKLCEASWGIVTGIDARRGAESTAEGDLRGVMVRGRVGGRPPARGSAASRGGGRSAPHARVGRTPRATRPGPRRRRRARARPRRRPRHRGAHLPGGRWLPQARRRCRRRRDQAHTARAAAHAARLLGEPEEVRAGAPGRDGRHQRRGRPRADGRVGRVPQPSSTTTATSPSPTRPTSGCTSTTPAPTASTPATTGSWAPYSSLPVLACHHLFASPRRHVPPAPAYDGKWAGAGAGTGAEPELERPRTTRRPPLPFSGPRADYAAYEAEKHNRAALQALQARLPASLMRAFRSPEHVAADLLPYLVRLVSPDVKPVLVGGGGGGDRTAAVASVRREAEKAMVRRAADVLADVGVALERGRIDEAGPLARLGEPPSGCIDSSRELTPSICSFLGASPQTPGLASLVFSLTLTLTLTLPLFFRDPGLVGHIRDGGRVVDGPGTHALRRPGRCWIRSCARRSPGGTWPRARPVSRPAPSWPARPRGRLPRRGRQGERSPGWRREREGQTVPAPAPPGPGRQARLLRPRRPCLPVWPAGRARRQWSAAGRHQEAGGREPGQCLGHVPRGPEQRGAQAHHAGRVPAGVLKENCIGLASELKLAHVLATFNVTCTE